MKPSTSDTGTATTTQANTLADATDAVVTATLSDGDMATLAGLSETGNAYSITITDTSVDAAALNTLDGKTTVAINATNITTLTGAAADLNTAYTANDNGSISGLSNEDVTLSDTTLDVSVLNTLDGNTSGTIDASSVTTLTGAAADLNTAYTANDNGSISGLSNEDVTLSDTTLDVSILNTLDGNTSGTIDASSITTLNGVADDLITAYAANGSGISGLGNEAVNVDSGTATTDQANTLAAATSAVVTATLSDGDMATLAGLSETGNAYSITITDTSVDAAALNTLDGKTTVAIDASNITTLTGAAADLNTAYTANDNGSISGLSNEDVTLSDTTLDVSTLNTLDGNTSGTIDASSINTLTGAAEDLNTAYDSAGITGLDDEDVTLSDTTLDAAVLNTLDGNTAGAIDASSITTLTGSTTELTTAYASSSISTSAMKPSTSTVVPPPPTRPTHWLRPHPVLSPPPSPMAISKPSLTSAKPATPTQSPLLTRASMPMN